MLSDATQAVKHFSLSPAACSKLPLVRVLNATRSSMFSRAATTSARFRSVRTRNPVCQPQADHCCHGQAGSWLSTARFRLDRVFGTQKNLGRAGKLLRSSSSLNRIAFIINYLNT